MQEEIKEILDKLQKVANRETASRNALMEMKDKDYQLLLDYITNLQEEIERLNNIIDGLEKWLNEAYEYLLFTDTSKILRNLKEQMDKYGYFHDLGSINDVVGCIEKVKSKLNELKGDNK